ncbi:TIGR00282 family metallophosphoesterase [Candidatus Dependentiae bacterium]|nr:TIGR00282 family metallophosphoesterase [Candidatus Dependentiae bacterium]
MVQNLRFVFIGDIIGISGLEVFLRNISKLKDKYSYDSIVVNGENCAKNGKGISEKTVKRLVDAGVDVITSGNHIWQNKEIYDFLNKTDILLRPANYPSECPGKGYTFYQIKNHTVGIINLQGRGFMKDNIDCPFKKMESLLTLVSSKAKIIFVDFHAETTAEKQALVNFLDGKITGLFGTHTHVQTSDQRILPFGTAYITDLGFCGALNSIIGMEKDTIIKKFITQLPTRFKVEKKPPFELNGIFVEVNSLSKVEKIERIKILDEQPVDL